jgi:glucose/mannose-6-phosphate isomerase
MSTEHRDGTDTMFQLVHALGDQLLESAHLQGLDQIQPLAAGCTRIVLCGMGGSAIAGDLVQPLLAAGKVSLQVWRDYGLPHWVNSSDLVICSSYSGQTEESLSGAREAAALGCARLAITSGGTLAAMAEADGFPAVILPGGLPPRASLGLGLGALVRSLGRLGLVADSEKAIAGAAVTLNTHRQSRLSPFLLEGETAPVPEVDPEGNIAAADLAELLVGKMTVIYTAEPETHAVGIRLKAQLNENSKAPACVAAFPELDHNDLVGWCLDEGSRDRFVLLILRGLSDNARIDRRVELTRGLLAGEFPEIHEIVSGEPDVLARTMSLVQYADFLSCHLARLGNVDPLPVDRITRLKEELG